MEPSQEFFATSVDMVARVSLRLLLVHSPLVGPSSWKRLADMALSRGYRCEVPDLTGVTVAEVPMWEQFVSDAVAAGDQLEDELVVVGHSGAGVFLPLIADRLGDRVNALVFVDAVVPVADGGFRTSTSMRALVATHTVDGVLLPWMDWWPADLMNNLVPEGADRDLLRSDLPRLPAAFYDDEVPMPAGWSTRRCCFLQLSEGYVDEREEAARRGWPTDSVDGTHLSIVTEPDLVLDAVVDLRNRLD